MIYYTLKKTLKSRYFVANSLCRHFFYPHPTEDIYYCSSHTYKHLQARIKKEGVKLSKKEFSTKDINHIRKRLFYNLNVFIEEPVPVPVLEEIYLILITRPNIKIEYLGRNIGEEPALYSPHDKKRKVFYLDRTQGRRRYFWYIHPAKTKKKLTNPDTQFAHLKKWFDDPDSRIILSIGGGGLRIFAANTVLKILDAIDVRKHIDEVWGCSSGSVAGSVYAYGLSPALTEQFGYALYYKKFPDAAAIKSPLGKTLAWVKNSANQILNKFDIGSAINESRNMATQIMRLIEEKQDRFTTKIPFFAVATNSNTEKIAALCEKKYITPPCKKLLFPAPRLEAIAASSAIPYVIKPQKIKTMSAGDAEYEEWVDGVVSEEVAIVLPYLKKALENAAAQEKGKPYKKKMKIFYINLSARVIEIPAVRWLEDKGWLSNIVGGARLIDRILDANMEKTIAGLNITPHNDVIGVTLKLGKLGVLDIAAIPDIIDKGREFFVEEMLKLNNDLKK